MLGTSTALLLVHFLNLLLSCTNHVAHIFVSGFVRELGDRLACLDDSKESSDARKSTFLAEHGGVHEVFASIYEIVKSVSLRRIQHLCIFQVYLVVLWLLNHHFFEAIDGFRVVLICKIHIGKGLPRIHVFLVTLDKLVENDDGLVCPAHISVQGYQSLHRLFVFRVLLDQVNQDGLSLVKLTLSFVKTREHAHDFDRLWDSQTDHLDEELGPLELLELASSVEKFLNQIQVVDGQER